MKTKPDMKNVLIVLLIVLVGALCFNLYDINIENKNLHMENALIRQSNERYVAQLGGRGAIKVQAMRLRMMNRLQITSSNQAPATIPVPWWSSNAIGGQQNTFTLLTGPGLPRY